MPSRKNFAKAHLILYASNPLTVEWDAEGTICTLRHRGEEGASAQIYAFGATITSWRAEGGQEQLFLSSKAILNGSKVGGKCAVFALLHAAPPPSY